MARASEAEDIRGLGEWMERYLDGDTRALRHIYRALAPTIRRHVGARIRDEAKVDDIVQLTFIKAHRSRDSLRMRDHLDDTSVLHWYLAIARNTAIDEARAAQRRRRRTMRLQQNPTDATGFAPTRPAVDPQSALLAREARAATTARVRAALAELPAPMREVVERNKLRGIPIDDIAADLDVRPGTLRVRAHRAYRRLASVLGVEPSLAHAA